jgi:anti-anti-sigma factor
MVALLPAASGLKVTSQGNGEVATLALAGELDMSTTPLFSEALDGLEHRGAVILDLGDLTFIDSHGLRAIFGYAATCELILARPHPHIARVLSLTSSDRVLRIEETLEGALRNGTRHQGGW